jgi:hypothetical protein
MTKQNETMPPFTPQEAAAMGRLFFHLAINGLLLEEAFPQNDWEKDSEENQV